MSVNLSGLPDRLKDYFNEVKPELIPNLLVNNMPFEKYVHTETGVVDELELTNVQVGGVLQPGAKDTFNPTAGPVALTARTGKVRNVKVDLQFSPTKQQELVRSYLSHMKKQNLNYEDVPFEEYFMPLILASAKNDLARTLIWNGVFNNSNTGVVDCFNGLATAAKLADNATPNPGLASARILESPAGGMTISNAVAEFEKFIDLIPYAERMTHDWAIVCDPKLEGFYRKDYRIKFSGLVYNTDFDKKSPDGYTNIEIIPDVGMINTNEMYMFPTNMQLSDGLTIPSVARWLVDDEGKFADLKVETDKRNLNVMLDFKAGVEWADIRQVYRYEHVASGG